MNSFSQKVKAEAAGRITGRKKCDACLAGMLLFSKELSADRVRFQTENSDVRDLFVRLCEHAASPGCAVCTERKRSGIPPLYIVTLTGESVSLVFSRAGLSFREGERRSDFVPDFSEQQFGSFAAGVFLSCGSVVTPEKGYHLELVVPEKQLCDDFSALLEDRLSVSGRIFSRGGSFVLYFKESGQVEDILTLIGAQISSLELMNVKIYKDVRNKANRATNCDTANVVRQNRSSERQLRAIEELKGRRGGLDSLPDELRELCELRLKYPEMSLSELKDLTDPPISRSGVNHRFERILRLAEEGLP